MASIGTESNGRRRVLFSAPDGRRMTLRLGKCSKRQAEYAKARIEDLIAAQSGGGVCDETAKWLRDIPDAVHRRLVKAGLAAARLDKLSGTLRPFLENYIKGRTDVKENTRIGLGQAKRNLLAFFGDERRLKDITAGDAEEWWRYLIGAQKLAVNTARRLCGRAKQFFRFAMRKGLIQSNPFIDLESNVRSNPDRIYFVSRETAQRVIDCCPDSQWRLLVALCRYGGLRCPSETLAITWADVNWQRGRIRVPSPKTEHIEGRAFRTIPIFPELRPYLAEAYAENRLGHVITKYRRSNANLRTQLNRIIKRAGLSTWPKLFQNLRATRQTELADSFPAHVVCAWMGNTEVVARGHYLHVTESHFARAIEAAQFAARAVPKDSALPSAAGDSLVEKPLEKQGFNDDIHGNQWPLSESNRYALSGNGF